MPPVSLPIASAPPPRRGISIWSSIIIITFVCLSAKWNKSRTRLNWMPPIRINLIADRPPLRLLTYVLKEAQFNELCSFWCQTLSMCLIICSRLGGRERPRHMQLYITGKKCSEECATTTTTRWSSSSILFLPPRTTDRLTVDFVPSMQ